MGKKLTIREIEQHIIDNPMTGLDHCSKCQEVESQGAMKSLNNSIDCTDLICDECGTDDGLPEAEPEELPMREWNVPVMRIGYSHNLIAVSARTEEEAIELALEAAGGEDFSEKSSEYEATDGAHLIG